MLSRYKKALEQITKQNTGGDKERDMYTIMQEIKEERHQRIKDGNKQPKKYNNKQYRKRLNDTRL